eukprot:TRINITY_DN84_c0_g1_i7.p1 TRINITY_DN84_c0_g1~~TRINITY_DN84_c0_g1_i7.p1  ORF type:complete len:121 (-),score=26.20 TRINITY_DN84_c0_g1_i7:338-700(-)
MSTETTSIASSEPGNIIYEVNLFLDQEIETDYLEWLRPHMDEMLKIDGFLSATLTQVENLGEHPKDEENEGRVQYTALYVLKDREAFDSYVANQAKAMRGDAFKSFAGKFLARRKLFTIV